MEEMIVNNAGNRLANIYDLEDHLLLLDEDSRERKEGEKELLKLYREFNNYSGKKVFNETVIDLNEIFI